MHTQVFLNLRKHFSKSTDILNNINISKKIFNVRMNEPHIQTKSKLSKSKKQIR